MTFDPEGHFSKDSSIFGLPKNSPYKLALLASPWEPTTSFKKGCKNGPEALLQASKQMDLYHPYFKKVYERGISWLDKDLSFIEELNLKSSKLCDQIQSKLDEGLTADENHVNEVNKFSSAYNDLIYKNSLEQLKNDKTVGLVGGDHSCPFGLIKALSELHETPFSIVHIDAHFDFRESYQGFKDSHASIMYNVRTELDNPPSIYQLGIRDFCESEFNFAQKHSTFSLDQEFQKKKLEGKNFSEILGELFSDLHENIYISFDIDGLSPEFCPNTGTPVPGGLSYSEAQYMIEYLHKKGHRLIGFDLVEVSPNQNQTLLGEGIDEITAVRILYALSCFALSTN